ncbi:XrtA/PEP-CTERM system TPR-repeat protein PrsT [Paraglaciecola psychrophila]|uniref:Uncharacterized protein n=1 Tax=Paraglaciecola psychrophila 170 TaxID=1129794 RepID=K7AJ02_9ALTE|nr:XrtA/PEP-CTERM system TPR-repeat protein PrsT [Paraglaciecola psychrophila]AGH46275.1 hypothetical protein C427_4170 [Paraglaciecola psychrophila 170]GAC40553.1 hypothetical protein GPSY_4952 [Paraglaciecola psychrophila 170]
MKFTLKVLPVIVTLALVGCSEPTPDEYIAEAQVKITQDQTPAAIILIKNAIQADPKNPEARYLLGKVYVERGAAEAAEKELTRALELGYEPNDVLPLLAKAYNLQYKNQQIIDLVDNAKNIDPVVETSLLLYQTLAYFALDKPAKAKQAVAIANEISAESIYSQLGSAYLSMSDKQLGDAIIKIETLLSLQPDLPEANLLKAQLATLNKDFAGAVTSFEKYYELLPEVPQSRIFLAIAYIKNQQFELAEKHLDLLLKINSTQPFLNQLKGLVRYQDADFGQAKIHMELAIQNGLDNVPNRVIAGIIATRLENYEQAYRYLESVQEEVPDEHPTRGLFAAVALKLGYNMVATNTLIGSVGLTENDMPILSAASVQLLRDGKLAQGKKLLSKFDSIDFTDPMKIAQKGLVRLSLNDLEGIVDLKKALSLNPDLNAANVGLAFAYINNGLYAEAIELGEKWILENPDNAEGYILTGIAYSKTGQNEESESMYRSALKIDKSNPAANLYYVDKAVKNKQPEIGLPYLDIILNSHPTNMAALGKYFVIQHQLGNTDKGLVPLLKAINENPGTEKINLLYAQALFTSKRFIESIETLEKMEPSNRYPNEFWIVLGNSYFFTGQKDKALNFSQTWVKTAPLSKLAHLRQISINEEYGNLKRALELSKTGQVQFPNDPQFTVLAVHFSVLNGELTAARANFDLLTTEIKSSNLGQGLEGQILLESGDAVNAFQKLKRFYEDSPSDRNATFVAKAFKYQQKLAEAISFLKEHIENGVYNISHRRQIAELAIGNNDYEEAALQYFAVLERDGNDLRALNNLANIMILQKSPVKALKYAQQAFDILPDNASIMDTYAYSLHLNGETQQSLPIFRKAIYTDPSATEIGVHYLEALLAVGQIDKAKILIASLKTDDPALVAKIAEIQSKI